MRHIGDEGRQNTGNRVGRIGGETPIPRTRGVRRFARSQTDVRLTAVALFRKSCCGFFIVLQPGKLYRDVKDGRAKNGHGRGEKSRMPVVAFGNKITCSDKEKRAGEDREHDAEILFGKREEQRRRCAEDGSECIDEQPFERSRLTSRIFENKVDGIDAV